MSIFRCYDVASLGDLPQCVMDCWELLRSEAFFLLLSNFTGLRLHYLCPNDDEEDDENEEAEGAKEQGDTPAGESSGSLVESSSSADASRAKGACHLRNSTTCKCVCFDSDLLRRAKHARMLWRAASLVPRWLHPVARRASSAGRVCAGPCFALLLSRWVFNTRVWAQNKQIHPIVWLLPKLNYPS